MIQRSLSLQMPVFRIRDFAIFKSLGWDFIGRIRGTTLIRLENRGEEWLKLKALIATRKPEYLGAGGYLF